MGIIENFCDTAALTPVGEWRLQGGAVSAISAANGNGGSSVTDFDTPVECPPGTVVSQSSLAATYTLECSNFAGSGVELDGNPTPMNNLPVGFHIVSLEVEANISIINTVNGADFITMMQVLYDIGLVFDNPNLADGGHVIHANVPIVGVSYLTLFGGHWVFRFTFINNLSPNFGCGPQPVCLAQVAIALFNVQGVFDLLSWVIGIPDPGPYRAGDNVTVTATDNLDDITEIHITYEDPNNPGTFVECIIAAASFVSQTPTQLVFTLTLGCLGNFTGTVNVSGKGNGVQFSGFVMLGTIDILLENATGLYTLVKNKTDDTLYDRNTPGATIDVKIPNPFAKTGYIGG